MICLFISTINSELHYFQNIDTSQSQIISYFFFLLFTKRNWMIWWRVIVLNCVGTYIESFVIFLLTRQAIKLLQPPVSSSTYIPFEYRISMTNSPSNQYMKSWVIMAIMNVWMISYLPKRIIGRGQLESKLYILLKMADGMFLTNEEKMWIYMAIDICRGRCNDALETTTHIFRDCKNTEELWYKTNK